MRIAVKKINNGTLLFKWMAEVMKKEGLDDPNLDPESEEDQEKVLTWVLRDSPRLRAMLPLICEQVVQAQEKAIVWVMFPAQQALVAAVLRLCRIDAHIFHAGLNASERAELVDKFTQSRTQCQVLVCSYMVNSSGLNLQHLCRNAHLLDTAMSNAVTFQAIGRIWRLGQEEIVKIYDYRVPNSFNARQVAKNAAKAIPGLITELNREIFNINHTDEDSSINLGRWGKTLAGNLVEITADTDMNDIQSLTGEEVVDHIYKLMKGEET